MTLTYRFPLLELPVLIETKEERGENSSPSPLNLGTGNVEMFTSK
jgi:hypothetical protein